MEMVGGIYFVLGDFDGYIRSSHLELCMFRINQLSHI